MYTFFSFSRVVSFTENFTVTIRVSTLSLRRLKQNVKGRVDISYLYGSTCEASTDGNLKFTSHRLSSVGFDTFVKSEE